MQNKCLGVSKMYVFTGLLSIPRAGIKYVCIECAERSGRNPQMRLNPRTYQEALPVLERFGTFNPLEQKSL